MELGSSTRATFRFEPLRDKSRTLGKPEVTRKSALCRLLPDSARRENHTGRGSRLDNYGLASVSGTLIGLLMS